MEVNNSATKAKNKYRAKNYDQINLIVSKGMKDEYKAIAEAGGKSLNAYINEAITEKIEREAGK
ncbi:MAG: antitoxin [Oscillospiraceae bacterium]|nr:antitoxin [Oscillospiraceae bacterium]MDD4368550.1 antitoxin [Oscillospiraceae bacterium]